MLKNQKTISCFLCLRNLFLQEQTLFFVKLKEKKSKYYDLHCSLLLLMYNRLRQKISFSSDNMIHTPRLFEYYVMLHILEYIHLFLFFSEAPTLALLPQNQQILCLRSQENQKKESGNFLLSFTRKLRKLRAKKESFDSLTFWQ